MKTIPIILEDKEHADLLKIKKGTWKDWIMRKDLQ